MGLEPCPFCGGVAGIERRQEQSMTAEHKVVTAAERYKVRCRNCVCGTFWAFYEEDAVNAWNRRSKKAKQNRPDTDGIHKFWEAAK